VKKIKEIFGNCDIVAKEKGYFILRSKKSWQFDNVLLL
jgi:16S rRNA G1207 methylase RsmC